MFYLPNLFFPFLLKLFLPCLLNYNYRVTNTLTYYGLMLTTSKLSGDRYLNNILACLAEFPAVILQQLLINRYYIIKLI